MGHDRSGAERLIRERLADLAPESIEIVDESDRHAGHAGAREGGHFRLEIVARVFNGQTRLQCQRMVLDRLGDLRTAGIHALAITARGTGDV